MPKSATSKMKFDLEIKLVPVISLKIRPRLLSRDFKNTPYYKALKASINKRGLIREIMVEPSTNKTYWIIDGYMRACACKDLGIREVPVCVVRRAKKTRSRTRSCKP